MIIEGFKKDLTLENFLEIKKANIDSNNSIFGDKIKNFEELYHIILRYSIPFFKNDDLFETELENSKIENIVFANNNSIISLFDGLLTLLRDANYLAAQALQRSIFEFLVINNHIILTKDSVYVKKWIKGEDVKIVKQIIKKIDNKNAQELTKFWVILSNQNHASVKTTQSDFDWAQNYGDYIDSNFVTYMLLYFYNYQIRELYFPFIQSFYAKHNIDTKKPFKSDWFHRKDKVKELEKENNSQRLYKLVDAFKCNWKLKS